jgi:formate dehydrogenase beta subunit
MADILLATPDAMRESLRRLSKLKGLQADAAALADVQQLVAPALLQRADLLIEHLHILQDHYRALFERHLCALAQLMNLPMAQVYEVATFYHHFDVLADNALPARLTVRVCDGLSCELAGAQQLLKNLPAAMGADVRVVAAPCIGQCEHAPAVAVGQGVVQSATLEKLILKKNTANVTVIRSYDAPQYIAYEEYRSGNGYALAAALVNGEDDAEAALQTMESAGLRGLGGAGFPAGRRLPLSSWQSISTKASPARSKTAHTLSATRTAF